MFYFQLLLLSVLVFPSVEILITDNKESNYEPDSLDNLYMNNTGLHNGFNCYFTKRNWKCLLSVSVYEQTILKRFMKSHYNIRVL